MLSNAGVIGAAGVSAGGSSISDNFASATTWTAVVGTLSVASNQGHGSAWELTIARHNTPAPSIDHWAQAVASYINSNDSGGVVARCDGTNYYRASFGGGFIYLRRSNTGGAIASYNGGYTTGTTYTLKIEVTGSGATVTIKVYVNGALVITKNDTDAERLVSGSYVGVCIDRDNANTDEYVTTFQAGAV